jgi:acetyl esterase/lipase
MTRPLAALALLLAATGAAAADWTIGARTLPPPAGASAALRDLLAGLPAPDPAAEIAGAPRTAEGLRAVAAESDAGGAAAVGAVAARLGVTIVEDRLAGVRIYRVTPAEIAPGNAGRLFVAVHGGAFIKGAGLASTPEAAVIAATAKMPVIAVDYRMPPDHPAPAAVDDVEAVWRAIVADRPAGATAIGGSSAGGNIAIRVVQRLVAEGGPIPGAVFAGTPGVDLAKRGDSKFLNEGADRVLITWDGLATQAIRLYAGALSLDDPEISPINGSFAGFPPTYLVTGTRDLLLSDTIRAHRALRRAGVEAELHVYEGVAHADYLFALGTPEAIEHHAELARFLDATLD